MSETQSEPPPIEAEQEDAFLYHYTDLNAFNGIMEHKALWATHIKYLNDSSENALATNLVMDEVLKRANDPNSLVEDHAYIYLTLGWLDQPLYLVCFSEDGGDRLSQWRGYSISKNLSWNPLTAHPCLRLL